MKNPVKGLFSRKSSGDVYKCKSCGYEFPMKGASVSGWAEHPYGLHVHCPKCGATVAQYLKMPC